MTEASPPGTERSKPGQADSPGRRAPSRFFVIPAFVALLLAQYLLSLNSLTRETPTVDEVSHLVAGITAVERGTFGLYPLSPPLFRIAAALPVVAAGPVTAPIYESRAWLRDPPDHPALAHEFAFWNADRYLELFERARLVMPLFLVLGGFVVYLWSSRLFGAAGGLVSLLLWTFCPNVIAHGRLVTGDLPATSLGFAATYLFWRYSARPTWLRSIVAGVALGLSVLTKFGMLLLYGLWPLVWLIRELAARSAEGRRERFSRGISHGAGMVLLSLLVVNILYGFEGTGRSLGSYEFYSSALTRTRQTPLRRPARSNQIIDYARPFRENVFKDSWLARLPVPLTVHFVEGADVQKLEAEGMPLQFIDPAAPPDEWASSAVFLDGEMRHTGRSDYYLRALAYKVPEGTWLLGILALSLLLKDWRKREFWTVHSPLMILPAALLAAASFGAEITVGLRYVLPSFPYVYVALGRLAPWAAEGRRRFATGGLVAGALALSVASAAFIHPHYLAYFNWISGGPGRGSEHLLDSNID